MLARFLTSPTVEIETTRAGASAGPRRIGLMLKAAEETSPSRITRTKNGAMTCWWSAGSALPTPVDIDVASQVSPVEILVQGGLELPPAHELGDEALAEKLRELLRAMTGHGIHLLRTHDLSDRELYASLLGGALREEMVTLTCGETPWTRTSPTA